MPPLKCFCNKLNICIHTRLYAGTIYSIESCWGIMLGNRANHIYYSKVCLLQCLFKSLSKMEVYEVQLKMVLGEI